MPFVGIRKVRRASEQPRQGLDRPVWSIFNILHVATGYGLTWSLAAYWRGRIRLAICSSSPSSKVAFLPTEPVSSSIVVTRAYDSERDGASELW